MAVLTSQASAILAILLSVTVSGCAAVQQHHGDLYFEQIVGHKAATDQERADAQACAEKAGLGTATHVISGLAMGLTFIGLTTGRTSSGLAMGLTERDKMKSCLQACGYEVK